MIRFLANLVVHITTQALKNELCNDHTEIIQTLHRQNEEANYVQTFNGKAVLI